MSLIGLAVIAAWVVLLTTVFNLVLSGRLRSELDVVLKTRATTAGATVSVVGGKVGVSDAEGDEALDSGIWIYDATRAVERPPGSPALQRVADALSGGSRGFYDRRDSRLYVLPVVRDGARVATVVAAASTTPYENARREALVGSVILGLLLLLGAYPVLRLGAARALRPMSVMTQQAAEWSAHDLTQRFGGGLPYEELQSLAATLDGVLDRLAAIVRHEMDLSAELSHELRTPLSRIVAEVDLLLPGRVSSAVELDHALHSIRDSAMSMEHILESLFAAARAEMQESPGVSDARTAVETSVRTMKRGRVTVDVQVPPALAIGVEPPIVQRILVPLLDNAQRYAASSVIVTGRRTRDAIEIDVVDDGPGIASELRDAVFEPGRRGDVDDGHDGVGLGLALARRLARAAEGDVEVSEPGSCLRVRLPPA